MYGTKAALPHLKESDGSVINLGSVCGLVGGQGAAFYSAAKGGLVNVTQQMAIGSPIRAPASTASAPASSKHR